MYHICYLYIIFKKLSLALFSQLILTLPIGKKTSEFMTLKFFLYYVDIDREGSKIEAQGSKSNYIRLKLKLYYR